MEVDAEEMQLQEALAASVCTHAREQGSREARRAQELSDHALAQRLAQEAAPAPQVLAYWDFVEVPVPADGNCMYHAVLRGVPEAVSAEYRVDDVRRAIVDWVDVQARHRPLTRGETNARRRAAGGIGAVEVRLEHWGGDDELAVLASVLGAHFVVFEEELGLERVEIGDGNEFAVHLVNIGNIHFNLLRPRVP